MNVASLTNHGISSSYTHGRGNWTSGQATGKACSEDSRTTGPPRDIVLAVAGTATLSPGIMNDGLPGVGLVLSVKVSASDDSACVPGIVGRFSPAYRCSVASRIPSATRTAPLMRSSHCASTECRRNDRARDAASA